MRPALRAEIEKNGFGFRRMEIADTGDVRRDFAAATLLECPLITDGAVGIAGG